MDQILNKLKQVSSRGRTSSSNNLSHNKSKTSPQTTRMKSKQRSVLRGSKVSCSTSSDDEATGTSRTKSEQNGGNSENSTVRVKSKKAQKVTESEVDDDHVFKFQFKAKNLPIADTLTRSSDPYFILKYNGKDIKKSIAIEKTLAPKWKPFHIRSSKFCEKMLDNDDEDIILQENDERGTTTLM